MQSARSAFFLSLTGGRLSDAGLAELLADFDQFSGQGLVSAEVGDRLTDGVDLVGPQRAGAGLAVELKG